MRSLRIVSAVVISTLSSGTVHGQDVTERQVIEQLDASPAAQAVRLRIDEARAAGQLRTVAPNPSVTYSQESALGTRDHFFLFRQEVPVSGYRRLLGEAADARVRAVQLEADAALRRLRAEARLAFVELLVAQERAAAVQRGLTTFQTLVDILRIREREGDSPRFDRLRAEREVADVRADLTSERLAAAAARARLEPYIAGAGPDALTARGDLAPPAVPPVDRLIGAALEARADYRAAIAAIDAETIEVRAAGRLRLPQTVITAGLKRSIVFDNTDTGYTAGLELRVPFFDHGQRAVAVATAARARAEAERDALRLRIESQVRAAHRRTVLALEQAAQFEREVSSVGEELAAVARLSYEEGEQSVLALLDAYRAALDASLRVIELRGQARQAAIELALSSGAEVMP